MSIETKPFIRYNENLKVDTFTVRMKPDERAMLERAKIVLEQKKDSTALKQLATIGANVLHGSEMGEVLGIVFKNKRKNKRIGINEFD